MIPYWVYSEDTDYKEGSPVTTRTLRKKGTVSKPGDKIGADADREIIVIEVQGLYFQFTVSEWGSLTVLSEKPEVLNQPVVNNFLKKRRY